MFFIVSKILNFLIIPLIWIFILFIITCFQKKPKRKNRFLVISILVLYLFSNEFVFNELVRPWEIPAKSYEELIKYDIGVVLGGVISYDEKLERIQAQRGFDRVVQAIELYKRGYIRKIFISGGSGSISFPGMKEALFLKKHLLTLGIPEEDILIEAESKNTRENALFTSEILKEHGLADASLLLITSAYHMRRAQACFDKVGLKTDPFSTDRTTGPRRKQPDYLFIPNSGILFGWNAIIHEWLGYLIYFFAGYL